MKHDTARPLVHHGMLLPCLGMLVGLAVDASQGGVNLLVSLCTTSSAGPSLEQITRLHWLCLPFMHVGTLVGGLTAMFFTAQQRHRGKNVARKLLLGLTCSVWMILGMNLGSYLLLQSGFGSNEANNITLMLAAMMGGMGVSMMAWTLLNRCVVRHARQTRANGHIYKKAVPS